MLVWMSAAKDLSELNDAAHDSFHGNATIPWHFEFSARQLSRIGRQTVAGIANGFDLRARGSPEFTA